MNYSQFIETENLANSGDNNAILSLAQVYETEIGRVRFSEAVRKFHLLIHRAVAMQLSQGFRSLVDREPSIASAVNSYKEDPSLQNLQTMLQILLDTGKKYGEDVFTKICYVISTAFKTLAKEFENILNSVMVDTYIFSPPRRTLEVFMANPSFKTFVECIKALNEHYKSIVDRDKAEELLFHLVSKNNPTATSRLVDDYGEQMVTIKRTPTNDSLLGYAYTFSTIWDKAQSYTTIPI